MKFRKLMFVATAALFFIACGERSDTQIQLDLSRAMAATEGAKVTSEVNKGNVVLNGECKDRACVEEAEKLAYEIKGVKSVTNNIKIVGGADGDSLYAGDELLTRAIQEITAGYDSVSAEVDSGVVVLKGVIERNKLQELMQRLHQLKPKRIDNQLVIK